MGPRSVSFTILLNVSPHQWELFNSQSPSARSLWRREAGYWQLSERHRPLVYLFSNVSPRQWESLNLFYSVTTEDITTSRTVSCQSVDIFGFFVPWSLKVQQHHRITYKAASGSVKVGKLHLYRASWLGLYSSHFRRSNLPFSTVFILNKTWVLVITWSRWVQ